MAPRRESTRRANRDNGKQFQNRWSRPKKAATRGTSSSPAIQQANRVKKYAPTSAAKNRSRLLNLDPSLVLQITRAVGQRSLPKMMRSCQALDYRSSLEELKPSFEFIERFTRNIVLTVTSSPRAQQCFQKLLPYLQHASLKGLDFTCAPASTRRQDTVISRLNAASWLQLEDALCDPDNHGMRANLRRVKFPETDVERQSQFSDKEILDSRISLDFSPTLAQHRELFHMEAQGSQNSTRGVANGTPQKVCRRLLKHMGVPLEIDYFFMQGTSADFQTEPHYYHSPFSALDIQGMRNLTVIRFQDIDFTWLPGSIATSVDLSSVTWLEIIQCVELPRLFQLFMKSKSGIHIADLVIRLLDWETEHLHDTDPYGLASFIASFSSLISFEAKSCARWNDGGEEISRYIDSWKGHCGLQFYDADFGHDNDLEYNEMDALAGNCPGLECHGSRDNVLGAPLQDGEWSEAFEQEAPYIAETLATGFRALTRWKVYYNPAPIGEPRFDEWDPNGDVHRLLAHRLFGYFREACEKYSIECKLKVIILVARDVVILDRTFTRYGLPEGLAFGV